jgi:hypothetical protein
MSQTRTWSLYVRNGGKSSRAKSEVSLARLVASSQTSVVSDAGGGRLASTAVSVLFEASCPDADGLNVARVLPQSGTEDDSIFGPSEWLQAASFFLGDDIPCWSELELPHMEIADRLDFFTSRELEITVKTEFFQSVLKWGLHNHSEDIAERFLDISISLEDPSLRYAAVCALGRVLSRGARTILLRARTIERNPLIVSLVDAYIASAAENEEVAAA